MNNENLKPFQPGQSGNPSGKIPGTKNRSTIARKILEMRALFKDDLFEKLQENYPDITKDSTVEEIMTIVQAHNAVQGDEKAYKAIMDSAYGAPKQDVEHSGKIVTVNVLPANNCEPLNDPPGN